MSDRIEIIATESASAVHIVSGAGDSVVAIDAAAAEPEIIEVFGMRGEPGQAGQPGPSGLEAEVSTDFSLIYRLST